MFACFMSNKKLFISLRDSIKTTALKLKKVLGLFFIAICLLLKIQTVAIANVVTTDGILKGDHSKSDQLFHQGMQAYIESDFQQAYQLWKTAEEDNHSKAAFNLGRMWLLGQVPNSLKNEQQAMIYFKKSASLGYSSAQHFIQNSQQQSTEIVAARQDDSTPEANEEGIVSSDSADKADVANFDSLNNDWLKQYPDSSWVIQVFASQEPNLLKQMIRDFSLKGEAKILSERINSELWYKLVYGQYANKQFALSAMQSLPDRLRREKPWVRSITSIKKNLKQ